jgi:nucleotide-binding universal stress UspA family protein
VCEAILGRGKPTATILETIAAKKIDLTIMGTSALHGLERIVFDSTTEAVLRMAPCPVLTVGPRASNSEKALQSVGPVVFATDFHFTTIHAIRFAASFSQLTASPLHCLHVMPRSLEACTQCQVVPAIMSEALQQLANESGVVVETPICATTYGSEVSCAVVDYARQQKAKLIVLGVRKASLEASETHLHIAYRIITEAPCPVLTMAFASQPDVAIETVRRKAPALV